MIQKRTSLKKKPLNRTSNRSVSQLNEKYREYLTNFFDEEASVIIQGAVDDPTEKGRVYEERMQSQICKLSSYCKQLRNERRKV
jgi:hypothetical protein